MADGERRRQANVAKRRFRCRLRRVWDPVNSDLSAIALAVVPLNQLPFVLLGLLHIADVRLECVDVGLVVTVVQTGDHNRRRDLPGRWRARKA